MSFIRGLLNPNTGNRSVQNKQLNNFKWKPGDPEIALEAKMEQFLPRNKKKKRVLKAYMDNQIRECEAPFGVLRIARQEQLTKEYQKVTGMVAPPDLTRQEEFKMVSDWWDKKRKAALNAWNFLDVQLKLQDADAAVDAEFIKRFWAWLMGNGTDEEVAKTPWGRTPPYWDDEVKQYILNIVNAYYDYRDKLMKLAVSGNMLMLNGIDNYAMYYKYIVDGDGAERPPDDFLDDFMDGWLEAEKARIQSEQHWGGAKEASEKMYLLESDKDKGQPIQNVEVAGLHMNAPLLIADRFYEGDIFSLPPEPGQDPEEGFNKDGNLIINYNEDYQITWSFGEKRYYVDRFRPDVGTRIRSEFLPNVQNNRRLEEDQQSEEDGEEDEVRLQDNRTAVAQPVVNAQQAAVDRINPEPENKPVQNNEQVQPSPEERQREGDEAVRGGGAPEPSSIASPQLSPSKSISNVPSEEEKAPLPEDEDARAVEALDNLLDSLGPSSHPAQSTPASMVTPTPKQVSQEKKILRDQRAMEPEPKTPEKNQTEEDLEQEEEDIRLIDHRSAPPTDKKIVTDQTPAGKTPFVERLTRNLGDDSAFIPYPTTPTMGGPSQSPGATQVLPPGPNNNLTPQSTPVQRNLFPTPPGGSGSSVKQNLSQLLKEPIANQSSPTQPYQSQTEPAWNATTQPYESQDEPVVVNFINQMVSKYEKLEIEAGVTAAEMAAKMKKAIIDNKSSKARNDVIKPIRAEYGNKFDNIYSRMSKLYKELMNEAPIDLDSPNNPTLPQVYNNRSLVYDEPKNWDEEKVAEYSFFSTLKDEFVEYQSDPNTENAFTFSDSRGAQIVYAMMVELTTLIEKYPEEFKNDPMIAKTVPQIVKSIAGKEMNIAYDLRKTLNKQELITLQRIQNKAIYEMVESLSKKNKLRADLLASEKTYSFIDSLITDLMTINDYKFEGKGIDFVYGKYFASQYRLYLASMVQDFYYKKLMNYKNYVLE